MRTNLLDVLDFKHALDGQLPDGSWQPLLPKKHLPDFAGHRWLLQRRCVRGPWALARVDAKENANPPLPRASFTQASYACLPPPIWPNWNHLDVISRLRTPRTLARNPGTVRTPPWCPWEPLRTSTPPSPTQSDALPSGQRARRRRRKRRKERVSKETFSQERNSSMQYSPHPARPQELPRCLCRCWPWLFSGVCVTGSGHWLQVTNIRNCLWTIFSYLIISRDLQIRSCQKSKTVFISFKRRPRKDRMRKGRKIRFKWILKGSIQLFNSIQSFNAYVLQWHTELATLSLTLITININSHMCCKMHVWRLM